MDCVNHPGASATAFCQNCGKAMCAACARQEGTGQVLCEPCWTAWQSVRAGYAAVPPGGPNPAVATLLGFIPGVGAMYNGQFVKGFIHVAIFAVLVSMAGHYGVFGLFIAAWVLYQVFDAHHTARARRDGEPLPDPLGLNELANWFHTGVQTEYRRAQGTGHPGATPGPQASGYAAPYESGYQAPYPGAPPAPGFVPPAAGFAPPAGYGAGYPPPPPPTAWRRPEPVAAIILIGMGVLFLLGQVGWFSGRMFEYAWPILLIGIGAWLLARRLQETPPAAGPMNGAGPGAGSENRPEAGNEPQGGSL